MNDQDRDAQVQELLQEALELPAEERAAYVDDRCGDADLKLEILRRIDAVEANTHSMDIAPTKPIGPPKPFLAERGKAASKSPKISGYEIQSQLGQGGMGVVYKALHVDTDRLVALKIIRPDRSSPADDEENDSAVDRFRTEALAAARLEHDNIVTVYDVGQEGGLHYYAMRYVEGESLAEMVREAPLDSRRAAEYLEGAARALHEAHEAGVLHRDLKPHNIMIDGKTNRALVADFGLAKLREGGHAATISGAVFGSPPYMSPEQATDAASVTEAADIYGLGATLYHILTGRPPFQGVNVPQTLKQVVDQDPIAPREFNSDIDRDLETICLKCLQKDRWRRYATAEALADDLRRFLRDEPIVARPAGRIERFRKFARRNRGLVAGTASAVIALTLGLVGTATGMVSAMRATGFANKSLEQLREEEKLRTQAVIETFEQSGDLAAQRGRWKLALNAYNEALAQKPKEVTPLRIKRTRMLIALSESQQSRMEAKAILDHVSDEFKADALLLMGEATATEFSSDDKGISFYRQALETGNLRAADAFYVKAVLAEDVKTAIKNAEASIDLQPFRKDAHDFLIMLYALSGQREKLIHRVEQLQLVYPEDPNYVYLNAILLVLDGQEEQAEETMKSIGDRLSPQQLKNALQQLKIISQMLDVVQASLDDKATLTDLWPVLRQADKLATVLGRGPSVEQLSPLSGVTSYPVMQPMVETVPALSLKLMTLWSLARGDIEQLMHRYPMHELFLTHAQLCYAAAMSTENRERRRDNLVAAEKSAQQAIETELVITRIPPLARLTALASQMELVFWKQLQDEDQIAKLKINARQNVLVFLSIANDPNHRWHRWVRDRLWMLVAGAGAVGEYDLARQVCTLWLEDEPKDAGALQWLSRLEELDGHPLAAIRAAEAALKVDPDNKKAKRTLEASIKKLVEAASEMQKAQSKPQPDNDAGDEKPTEKPAGEEAPKDDAPEKK